MCLAVHGGTGGKEGLGERQADYVVTRPPLFSMSPHRGASFSSI